MRGVVVDLRVVGAEERFVGLVLLLGLAVGMGGFVCSVRPVRVPGNGEWYLLDRVRGLSKPLVALMVRRRFSIGLVESFRFGPVAWMGGIGGVAGRSWWQIMRSVIPRILHTIMNPAGNAAP